MEGEDDENPPPSANDSRGPHCESGDSLLCLPERLRNEDRPEELVVYNMVFGDKLCLDDQSTRSDVVRGVLFVRVELWGHGLAGKQQILVSLCSRCCVWPRYTMLLRLTLDVVDACCDKFMLSDAPSRFSFRRIEAENHDFCRRGLA